MEFSLPLSNAACVISPVPSIARLKGKFGLFSTSERTLTHSTRFVKGLLAEIR
ncbi:hypothetical protein [Pacificibacter sp.]|uniref:hypothetical protein n=1 Tax=Pacificibacter sp. TaxID=1917866 RepID=UPI003219BF6A